MAKQYLGIVGDSIELYLPSIANEGMTVRGEIVRVKPHTEGNLVAVKFRLSEEFQQMELEGLFALLSNRDGGGSRAHIRVAYRIDMLFWDQAELRAILEDISRGGVLMRTDQAAPEVGKLVHILIAIRHGVRLQLHARVVRSERVFAHGSGTLVGMQFEDTEPDDNERIKALVDSLVDMRI